MVRRMKKVRFELFTPNELEQEIKETGLIFLPVGSMEWHGPHMGMGMDTCNAYAVSTETARITGGIVFPPFYIGTETKRSVEVVKKLGFSGNEEITGMDFPANSLKSMYWPPELFEIIMRFQIEKLADMGFRKIVIINGHGADVQLQILEKLADELSEKYAIKVKMIFALTPECGYGLGHAGLVETAIMKYLYPEAVDISRLPSREQTLRNVEFGIVDSETFETGPNDDFSVRYDPRDATETIGQEIMEIVIKKCAEIVERM